MISQKTNFQKLIGTYPKKHFEWVIAKLVLILANQIVEIWEISFGKLVFMKSITESSFSRSHHGKNGNNTFVIFSIVPNFMMKFAFFSHVRVWLKGLKHMR